MEQKPIVKLHTFYPTDGRLRVIDISSNNNLPSAPFELITLYMGMISVLFVPETAPWNFCANMRNQNGWQPHRVSREIPKLLNCFEEFLYLMHTEEHALIESLPKFFDQKLQK